MNVKNIRKTIPGLSDGKIFVDSAGSSLMSQATLDAIQHYLNLEMQQGGYRVMEEFGLKVCARINC